MTDSPKFKTGDRVVCEDNADVEDVLSCGRTYTVSDASGVGYVTVMGDDGRVRPFYMSRFRRHEEPPPSDLPEDATEVPQPQEPGPVLLLHTSVKGYIGDAVNLPSHYARYSIEPVRFCMENRLDPFQFNVIKYVSRHDDKNGEEDLFKTIRYTIMYIRYLRGDPDWWQNMTPQQVADFMAKTDVQSAEWKRKKSYWE